MTEIGLIALPMTFIIITGGIDLSVGAIVGLSAVMLGYSWKTFGFPLPVAILFALFVGGLAGFVNGLVITRIKVPPLIMTIATLALYRGLAEGVSQAHSVRGYPEWFYVLGQGDVYRRADPASDPGRPDRRRGRGARPHDVRAHALRHRRQRNRRAIFRAQRRSHQARHLHALRPRLGARGGRARLARHHHAHGHGAWATNST